MSLLGKLSISKPHASKLKLFLDALRTSYAVRAVVVFGSAAKGSWNYRSDFDVLIVSDSMGDTWYDRALKAYEVSEGKIQPFVVTSEEFRAAVESRRYILWEALHDGIVVEDDGIFSGMRGLLLGLIADGVIAKRTNGWAILQGDKLE